MELILLLLVSVVFVYYLFAKYKHTYWSRRGVYSPPAHWLFGHFKDAIFMRKTPPRILANIYKSSKEDNIDSPVIGVYVFQKPFLVLRSPDIIKQIMLKDFNIFSDRYFAAKGKNDKVGTSGLFSIDNPEWKPLRTKLSPAFTTLNQKKLFDLMVETSENLKQHLVSRVPKEDIVDIEVRRLCNKYTTDVIASLSFGVKSNSFSEPEPEFYLRTRKVMDETVTGNMFMFFVFFFPSIPDMTYRTLLGEHDNYFRTLFWESMNQREKLGLKRNDLIDFLIGLKNGEQQSFRFEDDVLLAQSVVFLLAGSETSAITMTFTLLELAKNPEIQEKLRQEIREKIGKGPITYDIVTKMSYLHQVISETLRLYPPAPLIDRIALRDYKIPGTDIVIEKGTGLYVPLHGIHEDPDYFDDPLKYDPDRFSIERKDNIKPYTYLPFGDGPRVCIGMRTATNQTAVGLISILSDYEVFLNPDYKNGMSKSAMFLAPEPSGIHLSFKSNPVVQ